MSLTPVLAAFQFAAATGVPPHPYPFGVGERFDYSAKFGILSVGTASIQVASIDTVRGQPAFRFRFSRDGSA